VTAKIAPSHTPPIEDGISNLTDWVELKAIFSDFHIFSLSELSSLTEEYEDEENVNFVEQDRDNEDTVLKVTDEICTRQQVLQDAYPFELGNNNHAIRLKNETFNIGHWIYLYCLIISHAKPDGVNTKELTLNNQDRDILQIASVYAAAGHLGEAFSFGFPRSDHSNFFEALAKTFTLFNEGKALDCPRPGYSPTIKDGEVDIVAWQPMNDNRPGKLFMLGQVATGNNWQEKSIKNAIETFLDTCHFSDTPKSTPIPAMFIPYCIDEQYNGSTHDVILRLTKQFGIIYYRLRLPYYALSAFEKSQKIHRQDENVKISDFVKDILGNKLPEAV